MRIMAILVAIWGLVAMPSLCRAGVLVACCAPTDCPEETSPGCPGGCPNSCPGESTDEDPDDTPSSGERDCSSCADVCNLVSLAIGKAGSKVVASAFAAVVPVTAALADGFPSARPTWLHALHWRPRENLPFPKSVRPLLL